MTKSEITELIKAKALELGFSCCGITDATELTPYKEHFHNWLDNKYFASMDYMANNIEKRLAPNKLVEGAKSVIVLLTNYYSNPNQNEENGNPNSLKIARYAHGNDYHKVLKKKMKLLYNYIKEELYTDLEGRYFADSAPVLERALAVRAGLGHIGKNSNLINKKYGSFVFISELIVNIELDYDEPSIQSCKSCTRCIDACPTGAITQPYIIDANKCISFLTIENKDVIDNSLAEKLNDRVFGCDICQEVCPFNKRAIPHSNPDFMPASDFLSFTKDDWASLSEDEFNDLFLRSPIKRAKYNGMMRNVNASKKKK